MDFMSKRRDAATHSRDSSNLYNCTNKTSFPDFLWWLWS